MQQVRAGPALVHRLQQRPHSTAALVTVGSGDNKLVTGRCITVAENTSAADRENCHANLVRTADYFGRFRRLNGVNLLWKKISTDKFGYVVMLTSIHEPLWDLT